MQKKIEKRKKIVILGGGITGLSAARYLDTHADEGYSVTLVEAQETTGGQIVTRHIPLETGERLVLDGGVDYFDASDPAVVMLSDELGLQGAEVHIDVPDMHVLDDGQPVRLPQSVKEFVRSSLLTWQEKQRVLKELFISQTPEDEDESLAAFVTRRLGKPGFDKIVGPLLDGLYGGDFESQSVLTRFPELLEMGKVSGGLVKGLFGRKLGRKNGADKSPSKNTYFRFASGAQTIVDTLTSRLGIEMRLKTRALEVNKLEERYQVVLSAGEPIEADAVILATPANVSAGMLKSSAPESSTLLNQIPLGSTGSISLVFRSRDIEEQLEFTRLVIPSKERRGFNTVTRVSGGANQSIPEGFELFRVFFSGETPAIAELAEEEIVRIARAELNEMLGIAAQPVHAEVFRWIDVSPKAEVGHLELVQLIVEQMPAGIFLAGSSYHGMTVSDCIRQGHDTAEFCLQYVERT